MGAARAAAPQLPVNISVALEVFCPRSPVTAAAAAAVLVALVVQIPAQMLQRAESAGLLCQGRAGPGELHLSTRYAPSASQLLWMLIMRIEGT